MNVDDGLSLETVAPVRFVPLEAVGASTPGEWTASNVRVFQACQILDERAPADRSEIDPVVALELRRVDLKLTLLLDLTNELLRATTGRGPDRAEISLDAHGVTLTASGSAAPEGSLAINRQGLLEVFLNPSVPRPLKFFGRIVSHEPLSGRVRFEFSALSDLEIDQLERLIFRHHRQKVADSRGMKLPS